METIQFKFKVSQARPIYHYKKLKIKLNLQLSFVCCVKSVQFNKFVTCTQRDGNNPIQVYDFRFFAFFYYVLRSLSVHMCQFESSPILEIFDFLTFAWFRNPLLRWVISLRSYEGQHGLHRERSRFLLVRLCLEDEITTDLRVVGIQWSSETAWQQRNRFFGTYVLNIGDY